jgi:hypothetical protein
LDPIFLSRSSKSYPKTCEISRAPVDSRSFTHVSNCIYSLWCPGKSNPHHFSNSSYIIVCFSILEKRYFSQTILRHIYIRMKMERNFLTFLWKTGNGNAIFVKHKWKWIIFWQKLKRIWTIVSDGTEPKTEFLFPTNVKFPFDLRFFAWPI